MANEAKRTPQEHECSANRSGPSGDENKSSGERFFWHGPNVEGYYPTADSILFVS
jgi:hypothetical protein